MIYQQDWLMRQIEAMIQAILAVALGISANEQTATQIEDSITSYYPTLLFLGDYSIIGHSASTSAFFSCQDQFCFVKDLKG